MFELIFHSTENINLKVIKNEILGNILKVPQLS